MTLSVVIGTLNRLDQLRACLASIFEQTRCAVRVYVADAGSTDGTVEHLRTISSEHVVPVLAGKKLGQARAYNDVFRLVDTPYVCWLSDDNVVVNRGLDVAVEILESYPRIGMVALKVKDTLGPFVEAPYVGGVSSIGILNVNQGVLRTPILRAVGGFSEAFGNYGIDPDLTAKVLFSGHPIVYTRAVAIHHYRNWPAPTSLQYQAQMEKQKEYQRLYARMYGPYGRTSPFTHTKTLIWKIAARLFRKRGSLINSEANYLGANGRDWYNVLYARYISIFDPLLTARKPYHLVQRCPPRIVRQARRAILPRTTGAAPVGQAAPANPDEPPATNAIVDAEKW